MESKLGQGVEFQIRQVQFIYDIYKNDNLPVSQLAKLYTTTSFL